MSLSIATFNVKNLIGPDKQIYTSPKTLYDEEHYNAKVKWIG